MQRFRWVLFLLAAMPTSGISATDPACMQRCQNSGSSREYCESVCTYKSQVEAATENSGYKIYVDTDIYGPVKRAQEYKLSQERAQLESERIALERMRIAAEREKLQARGTETTSANVYRTPVGVSTNALWRSYLSLTPNHSYNEWLNNALPRAGNYERFFETVLDESNVLSEAALARMKDSKYAADIAYYLSINKAEAITVAKMRDDELLQYMTKLEMAFQKN